MKFATSKDSSFVLIDIVIIVVIVIEYWPVLRMIFKQFSCQNNCNFRFVKDDILLNVHYILYSQMPILIYQGASRPQMRWSLYAKNIRQKNNFVR